MHRVNCYHCGGGTSQPYAEENGYCLVKCHGCGLLYVNPRPDDGEISQAHRLGVHSGQAALDVTGTFSNDKVDIYRTVLGHIFADEIRLTDQSWLDIGCGHGEFAVALQRFSGGKLAVRGVEPNARKMMSARLHGVDVHESMPVTPSQYEFMSLLNVFSHLPDPPAVLREWKRLLKPRGLFLLQTGDTAELKARDHHRPFYLPDHLSFASEKIVCELLVRLGFEVRGIYKYPYHRDMPPRSFSRFGKEVIKAMLPGRVSRIADMFRAENYAKRDMYVLAQALN